MKTNLTASLLAAAMHAVLTVFLYHQMAHRCVNSSQVNVLMLQCSFTSALYLMLYTNTNCALMLESGHVIIH